jgi:ATP-dependent helicase/nuclease subunit B
MMMTIRDAQVLLSPIGMGKTEHLINSLVQAFHTSPNNTRTFLRVWVLLATKRQETAFRQRLSQAVPPEKGVFFNIEFFNFYELYSRLLDMNAQPQRLLDHAQRLKILADVVESVRDQLTVFHQIADKVGFLEILSNFIDELKQHQIEPFMFADSAQTAKDRDIVTIYQAYQARLIAHDLVDREGQGWLTDRALNENPHLAESIDLLLVDGFDQFTPLQANVLAQLAKRVQSVRITLTHIPQRADTIGRRFTRALDALKRTFGEALTEVYLDNKIAHHSNQHPDLHHLTANIFQYNAPQTQSSGAIRLLEAPDQPAEVANVLRMVKKMLLEGVPPDNILIALRDWGTYQTYFSTYARLYDLPIVLHYGEPLLNNPAVVALMDLLKLPQHDFKYRDVLDTLRSPYWRFDILPDEAVQMIIELGTRHHVVSGRGQWEQAITSGYPPDDRDDRAEVKDDQPSIDSQALLNAFQSWADAITPPPTGTLRDYIIWLESLIGADHDDPEQLDENPLTPDEETLVSAVRQDADDTIISRDISALEALKSSLKTLLITDDLMTSLGKTAPTIKWDIFHANLKSTLSNQSVNRSPSRFGQVLVTTATDARGLPHDHVFIMGLSEGIFPAPIKADPLYLDNERETMQFADRPRLQTQAERHADDGLFYELISIPTQSLTLSRPAYEDGKAWLPSNLWRQVTALFSDHPDIIATYRQPLGEPVALENAITFDEVATAIIHTLTHNPHDEIARGALNWLAEQAPDLVHNIELGLTVELSRYQGKPSPYYDGQLDAHLLPELQTIVGTDRRWSASRLNTFGDCGFRFFGQYVLKLEELTPPVEGLDILQRGNIYHEILEKTYQYVMDEGLQIEADNLETVLKHFEPIADDVLNQAPDKYGFRPDELWRYERQSLKERLMKFIQTDFNGDGGFKSGRKTFPLTNRRPFMLEEPYTFTANIDGEPLTLTGFIDRVDQTDEGLVVLDYKSGSAGKKVQDIAKGRDLQIALYIKALEHKGMTDIFGGGFWMLGTQELTGAIRNQEESHRELQDQAWDTVKKSVKQARAGQFAIDPAHAEKGKCNQYCEFSKMCRFSIGFRDDSDD